MKIWIGGVSALAIAFIPSALAIGATGWLGFTITLRGFNMAIEQEQRRAIYVGVEKPLREPVKIVAAPGRIKIERAEYEGTEIYAVLRNTAKETVCYVKLSYEMKSPDGTILSSGYTYATSGKLEPGAAVEARWDYVRNDKRAATIRLIGDAETTICGR